MSSRRYRVKEVFATLQGEGAQTGTAAVFLRFGGCNAWSGREEDRVRDLARTGARCAAWCDTEFAGGELVDLDTLLAAVAKAAAEHPARPPLVVCTGGEPLLQLDDDIITGLHRAGYNVAVETNGSVRASVRIDWLTVSPKWMDERWVQVTGDELKLVVPAFSVEDAAKRAGKFAHYFVQPQGGVHGSTKLAIDIVCRDPRWRLSMQTHKLLGLR